MKKILFSIFFVALLFTSQSSSAQTTINLADQCNCEVIKHNAEVNAGDVAPAGTDAGDLLIDPSGDLFFWDGDSWEKPTAAQKAQPWFNVATNMEATDNTQNIYQLGNVGIGTTTPTQALTVDGNITTVQDGQRISFPHSNQTDGNDGTIGSGAFTEGLNIIGTQTIPGNGRKVAVYGDVGIVDGGSLDVSGSGRIANIPAGAAADGIVTTDANGNIRQRTAAEIVAEGGGTAADGSETIVQAGTNATVTGTGTTGDPYIVNGTEDTTDGDAWGVTGEDQAANIGRTGSVGVGTTAPRAGLEISKTAAQGGVVAQDLADAVDATSADNYNLMLSNSDNGTVGLVSGFTGLGFGFNTYFQARGFAANGPAYNILLNPKGGRIGIGTEEPTSIFDVAGNARVRTIPAGAAADGIVTTDANGNIRQRTAAEIVAEGGGSGADGDAWGVTGEDQAASIGRTGSVGIGTTTPTQALTVDGNMTTVQDGQRIIFPHSNQEDGNDGTIGSGAFTEGLNIIGTQTVAGNGRKISLFGNVDIVAGGSLDVSGSGRIANIPAGAVADGIVTTDANGNIRQRTAAEIVAEGGGSGADGDAWGVAGEDIAATIGRTGNVGVGTTTPTAKLQVAPTTTFGAGVTAPETLIKLQSPVVPGVKFPTTVDFKLGDLNPSGTSTRAQLDIALSDGDLSTANNTVMTLLGNNRVGISTTEPRGGLEVSGSPVLGQTIPPLSESVTTASDRYNLVLSNSDNGTIGTVSGFFDDGSGNFNTYFQSRSFVNAVAFNLLLNPLGGNIGIGTTSPSQALTVDGNMTTVQDGQSIRFPHTNQLDGSDGIIGSGTFTEGLNIVGTQTVAGNGRKVAVYGDVGIVNGGSLDVSGSGRIANIPAGAVADGIVTTDANGNIRQRTAAEIVAEGGGSGADGDAWGVAGEDIAANIGRTGSVGVGTTAPRGGLEISKTVAQGGTTVQDLTNAVDAANSDKYNLVLSNSDNGSVGLVSGFTEAGGGFNTYLQTRSFQANGSAYNLLLNPVGGRVGIGTDTPTQAFTVDGNMTTVQDGQRISFPHSNQQDGNDGTIGSGAFTEGLNIVGTQTVAGNGRKISLLGNVDVSGGNLDVSGSGRIANIPAGAAADGIVTTDANGNIRQRTAAEIVAEGGGSGADGDAWGVAGEDQAASIVRTGSVGIGVATPTAKLDVNGVGLFRSGSVSSDLSTAGTQVQFGFLGSNEYRHGLRTRHDGGSTGGNAIDFYVWDQATNTPADEGTKRVLTLDGNGDNGNVQVLGDMSVAEEVTIAGETNIGDLTKGVNAFDFGDLSVGDADGNNAANIYVTNDNNATLGVINTSGNNAGALNLATSAAQSRLIASTGLSGSNITLRSFPNSGELIFRNNNADEDFQIFGNFGEHKIVSELGGSNAEIHFKSGHIGIGTATPRSGLEVSGSPVIGQTIPPLSTPVDGSTDNFNLILSNSDNGTVGTVSGFYDGGLGNFHTYFQARSFAVTEAFNLLFNPLGGNVGIGTISPSQRLSVDGNIQATGSLISGTTTYPDYVFEAYEEGTSSLKKDYAFKSLDEVETFIKANKHLPGVTSINELNKNELGKYEVNFTTTSIQTLEKVEELFLYTIEQDKKIKALEKEVAALKALKSEVAAIKALLAAQK